MTKTIAVSMVKNEIDILPYVVNHLLDEGIDAFFFADNMSTDGTYQYLWALQDTDFTVIRDEEVGYYQCSKMNQFVRYATALYGDDSIILPFDADEMFYSLDRTKSLSEALKSMPCDVAVGTVYDHVPTNTDESTGNPLVDMKYRMINLQSPPSVAFKYHPDAYLAMGNHSVGHPGTTGNGVVGVRHFQYRSFEQYVYKLRNGKEAYDATNLPYDYGTHWRLGGAMSDEELRGHWDIYTHRQDLIYDPAPLKSALL